MVTRALSTASRMVESEVRTRGLFPGEALERAKVRLVELLDASMIVRGTTIGADGRRDYVEVPDNAIRLAAAVRLIELETGKAPQTVDVRTQNAGPRAISPQDLLRMVLSNPGLARAVIDETVKGAKATQEHVDVGLTEETPSSPPESESGSPQR